MDDFRWQVVLGMCGAGGGFPAVVSTALNSPKEFWLWAFLALLGWWIGLGQTTHAGPLLVLYSMVRRAWSLRSSSDGHSMVFSIS